MKALLRYNEVLKVFDLRYGVLRSQTYFGRNDIFSKKNHKKEPWKTAKKTTKRILKKIGKFIIYKLVRLRGGSQSTGGQILMQRHCMISTELDVKWKNCSHSLWFYHLKERGGNRLGPFNSSVSW